MKHLQTLTQIAAIVACIAVSLACGIYVANTATPQTGPFGVAALGTTHLSGNLAVGGTLDVEGITSLAAMTYTEAVWTGATTFTNTVAADAGLTVDSTAFTVADTSGNVRTAGTLIVAGASTLTGTVTTIGNETVGGILTVTGASNFTDAATFTTNATIGGFLINGASTITPTNGGVITPTTSTVILAPAGAVTPTLSACVTDGTVVTLLNKNNAAIVLADSTNLNASAALSIGQYDTLQLICFTNVWYELSTSAN